MRRLTVVLAALLLSVVVPSSRSVFAQSERCFTETNQCISGVIRQYWESNGGLPVFGYPITALTTETNADGFTGPTQWFERDRLEDHSAEGQGVLAGRLGAQKLAAEGRPWETLAKVTLAAQGCRYFSETGHSLCPPFRAYWESNGGLARFGFPISEPVVEQNAAGFTGTFQWFERRRMEAHPENQPPFNILLGLLGNEVRGSTPPPSPLVFNGQGDLLTQRFTLSPGLYLVESQYVGSSNFIVQLLDADGKYVDLLANVVGDAKPIAAIYVKTAQQYVMEITSSGTWEVKFRQPSTAEVNAGPTAPTTISGQGDKVLFVNLPSGLNRFEYAHTGSRNFIVQVEDLQGRYVGLAANEIGNATGSKAVSAPRTGAYVLDISADGTWTIAISR